MRLLEGQLGLALIERSPRGCRLTPSGVLVAGWAQAAIDAASALDAGVAALRRERESRLRIAASMTVAEYLLPAWLTALQAVDPGAAVPCPLSTPPRWPRRCSPTAPISASWKDPACRRACTASRSAGTR